MKRTHTCLFAFLMFSPGLMAQSAQSSNQARPGSGGPLRPLKTEDNRTDAGPNIVAGERKAQFDRLDADKNGRLTQEEFNRIPDLALKVGSGIGTAGVNRQQAQGNPLIPGGDLTQVFQGLDLNHDGALTAEEFARMPVSKTGESSGATAADGRDISRSTGATVGKQSLGGLDKSALFHKLDKNGDGSLSTDEFNGILATELPSGDRATTFHQLDLDGDGRISKEEFLKLSATPPAASKGAR